MKRIIKAAAVCTVLFLAIIMAGMSSYAEEEMVSEDLMTASGAEDITDELQPDVQDILSKYGVEAGKPEAADSLGFSETMELITETVKSQASKPLRIFALLIVVVIFSSFLQSIQGGLRGGMAHMSGLAVTIAASAAVPPDICSCFLRVKETLTQCTDFMTAFTPVFAGIIITSGNPGTGLCYNTAVYAVVSVIVQVIGTFLLPVLSMCLALSIADAVNPETSLGGILRFTKTIVTWSLGFLMTIFLGVMSVQGIVRGTADSFATKTARYVVSNFVPFVGGAVSDAYSTVLGSLRILRSTTGFVGIVTICILFVPVLVQLVLYRFAVSGAAALSELFSVPSLTKLLRGIENTLQMTLAVLICFSVMFLVAIAIVLIISGGGTG